METASSPMSLAHGNGVVSHVPSHDHVCGRLPSEEPPLYTSLSVSTQNRSEPIKGISSWDGRSAETLSKILEAHRLGLRQCLDDWAVQQELILARTFEELHSPVMNGAGTHNETVGSNTGCNVTREGFLTESILQRLERVVDDLQLFGLHKCEDWEKCSVVSKTTKKSRQSPRQCEARSGMPKQQPGSMSMNHMFGQDHYAIRMPGVDRSYERKPRQTRFVKLFNQMQESICRSEASSEAAENDKHPIMDLVTQCVRSRRFEGLCATIIIINSVLIGYSSDYAMDNLDQKEPDVFTKCEFAFFLFYSIEICLRMIVFGRTYFCARDMAWNYFDMCVVFIALYEQIDNILIDNTAGDHLNLSFMRMLRLLKMLKLLRLIRLMRMFRELRLILQSLMGSMKAMIWAVLLLLTITYMFGVCFLQASTVYLQNSSHVDSSTRHAINTYWGSVAIAMHSLYMAGTAGKEWSAVGEPLREVGALFYGLFLLYIAFFLFVVMNTITSLFIEETRMNSDKDQQMVIQMELDSKQVYIDKLQALFDEIDDDNDGEVDYHEFCKHIERPEMHAFASSLEIDTHDTQQFFGILSEYGKIPVDIGTFVVGCIKLKGAARSMDLMDLMRAHNQNAQLCQQRFDRLEQILGLRRRRHSGRGPKADSPMAVVSNANSGRATAGAELVQNDCIQGI